MAEDKPSRRESFHYHPTPEFAKKLEKLKGEDPASHARLMGVIDRVLANPADSDGKLHGAHRGKLKKYAGKSQYRIVYSWCRACRKANEHLSVNCSFCDAIPDHSVVFFDLFTKADAKKLQY